MRNNSVLITGGAGFIGINTAEYFLRQGKVVTIVDNFSRKGSRINLAWLYTQTQLNLNNLNIVTADIRSPAKEFADAVNTSDLIIHLAAQVAVTTSVEDPITDFEINARGTLNVLEIARRSKKNPVFIYSSTNKVYGDLESVPTTESDTRYDFTDLKYGISENQPLDFHSPYGCSKGTADQYVRDYDRIYGLHTIVFRQSCIYGSHQFGIEDQGWLAWFMIALMQHKHITIYGDGKQVRDILDVRDLIRAYDLASQHIDSTHGKVYNIGGGRKNSLSIWEEFRPILEKLYSGSINITKSVPRLGDQRIFISDTRKALQDFNWRPKISMKVGIADLYHWISTHSSDFEV